ncbi:MAG: hypothetical protein ACUVX8_12070, partial [Candidatus Zipacnadales bacterium]
PGVSPNPTADLALTGIIETTDGLRALIEKMSTRQGEFVAVGEPVFGFVLQNITADEVTLSQGGHEYKLRLGEKEIQPVPVSEVAKPSSGSEPMASTSPSSPSSSSSGVTRPPGFPDFSGMSPEQRRDAYRRWWDSLSESQRDQYRSQRFGRSRGGPGGGRMGFEFRTRR